MTTDTSGRTSLKRFASFAPDTSSWRTSRDTEPEASGTFSGTWPKQGMTLDGLAYELPTWVPRIAGSVLSSLRHLLPTPTVNDSRGGRNETAVRLNGGKFNSGVTMIDALTLIGYLPDPRGHTHQLQEGGWGKYLPAIRRWEEITGYRCPWPVERPVGDPTAPMQLSPTFAEWLMGLAPGLVSAFPGLTRTQRLKILGNGVCPQQMEAAIDHLLEQVEPTGDVNV